MPKIMRYKSVVKKCIRFIRIHTLIKVVSFTRDHSLHKLPQKKIVAGIPKGGKVEDPLLEAKPRPLPDTALARKFRCVLRCETRGGALRSSASTICYPQRPARELHTTPSWHSALPAARVRLHASRDGAPQMAPKKLGPKLVAAGSPATSDAKARRHSQNEKTTSGIQTAPWNSMSYRKLWRCCT
ncbi:hypothetical protein C3747_152g74 [Trypanosoma cruzi]|uniref:Uncharacterized protein n=1 Tax=Trypanosoma cruzi TaxID=5693 RepID=A0A2V2W756_TRYCR|nr:hypothetical protein C3747_152g53 [Trypanosoma cruzi]PWV04429.1 hypothetical protein C3747_152g74 [Trypanosoma cruzi]RNC38884.1 ribonuclease HI [Trypanosoma cruzi]